MALGFLARNALLGLHCLQWASAVICLGIISHFIRKYEEGTHLIYEEVITVISVVFFLPCLVVPFVSSFARVTFPINIIFSYLWLTSFIFTSQDYSAGANCFFNAPTFGKCSLKHALQAFTFLTFFCTFASALIEGYHLHTHFYETSGPRLRHHTKEVPRQSDDTGITGTTAGTAV